MINLFLMDMSHADNTSGVDRYVGTLLKGLEAHPYIHVHWIHLRHDPSILFHHEEQIRSCTKITIPLPQQFNEIIAQKFWVNKYNEQIYRITRHLFEGKQNCIIHIHTLNLIDLAVFVRSKIKCKVITHLHCIPWKSSYNGDIRIFNELYNLQYVDKVSRPDRRRFITNNSELQSYADADHIICVTRCAMEFLEKVMAISSNNISVIPNGINDLQDTSEKEVRGDGEVFHLLYVGVLIKSKGLDYILEAMRKVKQKGYAVSLTVVGKANPADIVRIKNTNKDLTLNILGRIPFCELINYYGISDAGVIASLQEQSSYVAIEMAMFGLPVITTAVDGLDEIFTDNVNVLKVGTHFSKIRGLTVDTNQMADKIIMLIRDRELRERLGKNVRDLYEKELSLRRMTCETVGVYQELTEGTML